MLGQANEALDRLAEATRAIETTEERCHEAEPAEFGFWRWDGQVLLRLPKRVSQLTAKSKNPCA
jgi:hypothetical protein